MATLKILLVDDTKLFLRLEQEYLKHSSVVVLTAGNGREALEIVKQSRPDLVFMDLYMPEMDGITCCTAIKADPDICTTPVVLVTTEGMEYNIQRCKGAGCDGFLSKPVDRRAFLELARSFLPNIDRRERRAPCRVKVLIRLHDRENMYGTCIDLSTRGMFVAASGEFQVNDKVEVNMLVAGRSDFLVEAWGRIAWVNPGPARKKRQLPEGFGMEFLSITDESVRLIRQFLDQGVTSFSDGRARR